MAHAIDHADNLHRYLLGDVHEGPGLLRRVGAKVADLTRRDGPGFVSASIMGAGSHKHDSDPTEDAERVMDLAVSLYEWRGPGIGEDTERTRRELVSYIQRHRLSDAEILLGSKKVGKGALETTRHEIRRALEGHPFPRATEVERCFSLALYLREWLGERCVHDFQPSVMWSEATGLSVMVCSFDCGVWYHEGKDGAWLAL